MRILSALMLIGSTNLAAGYLLAYGLHPTSALMATACLLGAVLMSGLAAGWLYVKVQFAARQLSAFVKDVPGNAAANSGFAELDQLAEMFRKEHNKLAHQNRGTMDIVRELESIQQFLSSIDRRSADRESTEPRQSVLAKLQGILTGYSNDFESGVREAIACAREIGRSAQRVVNGADEQSDTVSRTTQIIESLSTQILSLSETADTAKDSTIRAREYARNGLQEFQEIAAELEVVRNQVATRERKLQVLGQHSREIGSIVTSIGTLSSRTDLLALNASIESVRAGEHGRGFALVAEEVRALSEQSAQAVLDIASRIDLIQLETQESISVASAEHEKIQQLIKRLSQALSAVNDMGQATGDSINNVTELAGGTQLQLKLLKEIVDELETSSEVAKGNRIQAESVHWTAKTLGQVTAQLQESVGAMRSGNAGSSGHRNGRNLASSQYEPATSFSEPDHENSADY